MNQFDSSDIVIHDIDSIQYHQNVIHPIEFTLQVKDLSSLWDYRWEIFFKYFSLLFIKNEVENIYFLLIPYIWFQNKLKRKCQEKKFF